jgi:hypothetical protein
MVFVSTHQMVSYQHRIEPLERGRYFVKEWIELDYLEKQRRTQEQMQETITYLCEKSKRKEFFAYCEVKNSSEGAGSGMNMKADRAKMTGKGNKGNPKNSRY